MLRAVLFDFDGLILDTETPEVEILKEVFAEHGQEFPDEYWINALGRGADQLVETPAQLLRRLTGKEFDLETLHKDIRDRTVALIEQEPVRPGIEDLLCQARELKLMTGIASSSKHWWVDGHLQRLDLFHCFDKIVCADDVPRAKPFPDLYERLMEELAITTEECFALEDSPNGIRGAKAAGVRVVAVPNSVSRRLNLSEADGRVETLAGVDVAELADLVALAAD